MAFLKLRLGLLCAVGLVAACSSSTSPHATGLSTGTDQGSSGASTQMTSTGSAASGAVVQAGSGAASGTNGGSGQTPSSGTTSTTGSGAAESGRAAASGTTATSSATTSSGAASGAATDTDAGDLYPPPPRKINVTGTGTTMLSFNGQPMYLNKNQPIQGKLVLLLGGICTGVGAGGFESFIEQYGFHVFGPKTDTCLDGGKVPQSYVQTLKTNPNDPTANAQIGDSRMELWDGVTRVNWYTVAPANSIVQETEAAMAYGAMVDPGGDWGYFLDPNTGALRTSDVWVVGYSWGSQTWAMISAYVPFDRVITTSGPQDEGFPNATWITNPPPTGTPGDRKYMLVGFESPYPSTIGADSEVMSMVTTVTNAGWLGPVTNVMTTSPGPYMSSQHLFAMIGGNGGVTPGGHTVFCNNNPANGWVPLCKYVCNQQ
jgi:hypothetical protein